MIQAARGSITAPKLRFPGFSEEWQQNRLGAFLTIKHGKPQHGVEVQAGGYPILASGGEIGRASKPLYSKPSVLIGRKGTIDQPRYMDTPFWTVDTLFYSELKDDNIAKFFYYYFGKINWRLYNEGSGVPSLSASTISSIDVRAPDPQEQRKIAEFLTVVDDRIGLSERKLELLKKHKQGAMQKIFTQQIRFKDSTGRPYPKWEEKELREVAAAVTARNQDESISLVLTNSATAGIVNQSEYFDKDIANQGNLASYHVVSVDDFVYNPRISQSAPVGPIKRNHLSLGVMSPLYSVFRFKEGNLDFFEGYFSTAYWHEYIKSVANSGARHDRMNITTSDLYSMPIPFPSAEEQQKIAGFLTALDDKIRLEESKLEQAKQFKKSLLQRMFI